MPITIENFSVSTFLSVDFGDSSGSGFRINHNGCDYIITAKHVVYNKNVLLSDLWIKSRNYFGDETEGYSAKINLSTENVLTFDDLDVVVIKLDIQFNYEIENAGTDISIASIEDTSNFESILIGANIFLVGFPSSLTVDDFYDVDRPLLRTGIIAGKNIGNHTFVVDSVAYYGVSGGPIVQIDVERNIKIVGVVSRFVPFITEWKNKHESSISRQDFFNSGYAVCLPLDRLIERILQG
ncbi:trypsin-like peptidase domain-containing protein [Pedobacter sp. MC2016-15]|uniref:S1 family peptidase n=1 Tax=Pedobacter sp. MC2016-15 TaxID=2994473 RepID=UPI0022469055|nr:serine protease [Pedobacter sp. MC2016-15]MCX2477452.1 trypsin-like peptidase domain-containing protein [Pedobacter sp. MC2016-15]